jgi:hypothetical protein
MFIQAFVPWVGTMNYPHCLKLRVRPILLCEMWGGVELSPHLHPKILLGIHELTTTKDVQLKLL